MMPRVGGGAGFLAMDNDTCTDKLFIVQEALRHTELRLKSLEAFADNADRRAAILIAGSIAFSGFLWTSTEQLDGDAYMFIASALSLLAAGFAVLSLIPKKFHVCGHYWRDWKGHLEDNDKLIDVLISQAAENDERIIFNEVRLSSSARKAKISMFLLGSAALTALTGQILIQTSL